MILTSFFIIEDFRLFFILFSYQYTNAAALIFTISHKMMETNVEGNIKLET